MNQSITRMTAALLHHLARERGVSWRGMMTAFGVLAGVVQSLGFARWVFLVPALAARYVDPASTQTVMVSSVLLRHSTWLRAGGTVIAVGIAVGLLEPFGVAAAGLVNALAYVLWAGWLVAFGISLLRGTPLQAREAW